MKKKLAVALTVAVLGASALVAAPAYATEDSSMITTLTGGVRTATLSPLVLSKANYSHTAQTVTGTATLSVNDLTGTLRGWYVTQQASDITWEGDVTDHVQSTIDAGQLEITGRPSVTRTDAVLEWTPSLEVKGKLDDAVKVIEVPIKSPGAYTAELNYRLTLPAQASPGSYSGTITTTIVLATTT